MTISKLFYPRGVAVFGSMADGKLGFELVRQIVDGGYGSVVAINPKSQGAFNIPGYDSLSKVNQVLDLAVIASPANTVASILNECGAAGISAAVLITSGFSEIGNRAGEEELLVIAKRYGIRLIGPNCAGIVNTACDLFATLETRPPAGKMAFISQSGALGGAVLSWAEDQGVGISKFVSYGNRIDLDELELLPYFAQDPETKVVALYIESVKNGREFIRVINEFTKVKPLVIIKSGRTSSGMRATLSHTGSLAGLDAVYDSVIKQSGAIRVETVEDMFDLCKGFSQLPAVKGKKIAIVTNSGGPGILAADRAESVNLQVSEPSQKLLDYLSGALPPNCGLHNPYDLTVQGTEEGYKNVLIEVLKEVDGALAINVATPYLDSVSLARGIYAASQETGKPIATNFMAGSIVTESIKYLSSKNLPNYQIGERAISVLANMAEYETKRQGRLPLVQEPVAELTFSINSTVDFLEPDAMRWLKLNNFPVPEFNYSQNIEDALDGCEKIGYPVVMKVVSPEIIHKSEYGGVIVGIKDKPQALEAFNRLKQISEGKSFKGVIIYPFINKSMEILVGMSRDPQFGPVIVVGTGGIYTEILHDISLRVAPIHPDEAWKMITELKSFPILNGARGQEKCDLLALSNLIVNFSLLPFRYPEIEEIDLNPVFLSSKGALIADVRVIRK